MTVIKSVEETIEEIQSLKNIEHVILGHACSEPQHLLKLFCDYLPKQKKKVKIWSMIQLGDADYLNRNDFSHHSWFLGEKTRLAMKNNNVEFVPMSLYKIPTFIQTLKPDLALMQLSRKYDTFSFGLSVDYNYYAYLFSKYRIVQLNNEMPVLPHSRFDQIHSYDLRRYWLYKYDEPLIELKYTDRKETNAICDNVMEIIGSPSKCTLQLGIGSLPNKICRSINDSDIEIIRLWSELLSDGIMFLDEKLDHYFRHTCSMLMGTRQFYQYLKKPHEYYLFLASVQTTNSISEIEKQQNMISINNALMIDYQGQIASEAAGFNQISGIGGQFDFAIGSQQKDGKSIIVLPSHNKHGRSNIVKSLPEGTPVSIPRFYADYIVTENGWCHLRGKTLSKRKKLLEELI